MVLSEADRDRAGEACYRAWCEINTPLGAWHCLATWKKENFMRMADAVAEELSQRPVTARVIRIDHRNDRAS